MKKLLCASFILLLPIFGHAVPREIYPNSTLSRSVPTLSAHKTFAGVQPQAQWSTRQTTAYPSNKRVLLRQQAPHVHLHVYPQTQNIYQRTEEVYLPQGGTYRSVTTTIPHPIWDNRQGVYIQGHYTAE